MNTRVKLAHGQSCECEHCLPLLLITTTLHRTVSCRQVGVPLQRIVSSPAVALFDTHINTHTRTNNMHAVLGQGVAADACGMC